jgi:hypothetical protein
MTTERTHGRYDDDCRSDTGTENLPFFLDTTTRPRLPDRNRAFLYWLASCGLLGLPFALGTPILLALARLSRPIPPFSGSDCPSRQSGSSCAKVNTSLRVLPGITGCGMARSIPPKTD